MIIQAELKCKQTGCEADPCAVDKVIELPSSRFQQFSRALLADYDFIAENKNAIRHDEDARHCLLILDADGTDGFLVDPQGYNYLSRIEQNINDNGFTTRRATEQDLKKMLGVYFEQNVTTEKFEDFDGDRWVIVGE